MTIRTIDEESYRIMCLPKEYWVSEWYLWISPVLREYCHNWITDGRPCLLVVPEQNCFVFADDMVAYTCLDILKSSGKRTYLVETACMLAELLESEQKGVVSDRDFMQSVFSGEETTSRLSWEHVSIGWLYEGQEAPLLANPKRASIAQYLRRRISSGKRTICSTASIEGIAEWYGPVFQDRFLRNSDILDLSKADNIGRENGYRRNEPAEETDRKWKTGIDD